jgi:hypothetical protein
MRGFCGEGRTIAEEVFHQADLRVSRSVVFEGLDPVDGAAGSGNHRRCRLGKRFRRAPGATADQAPLPSRNNAKESGMISDLTDNAFYEIFPNGIAPVRCMVPHVGELELPSGTFTPEECYLLDGERLTPEQMEEVVRKVAEIFGARVADVREELMRNGLPIRASQCRMTPAIDLRLIL